MKEDHHTCRALTQRRLLAIAGSMLLLSGCMVGPKYVQPTVPPPPPAFKETPSNWNQANPQDQLPKGKWWEIYGDQQLNSLEEKIAVSNQNLKVAYQEYMSARDLVRQARSQLFPTVAVQPSGSRTQLSQNRPNFAPTSANQYQRYRFCRQNSPTRWTSGVRSGEPSNQAARMRRRAQAILRMSVLAFIRSLRSTTSRCAGWTCKSSCWMRR